MKCPKCGYECKDEDIICGMCSEPLKKEKKEDPPQEEDAAIPETPPQKGPIKGPTIIEPVKGMPYFVAGTAVTLFLWGWYLLEQFTDWRITSFGSAPTEEPIHILFPVIATVLIPLIILIVWKKAAGIAENGEIVTSEVVSVGGQVQGMRNVEITYSYGGMDFSKKKSTGSLVADDLYAGDRLNIIVDKRNPDKFLIK